MKRSLLGFYVVLVLIGLVAPWLNIYPVYLMTLYAFAIFACAFNLLLGFGGMLSFGHAAYFGLGAYTVSWLVTALHWNTVPAIVGGMLVAMLGGLAIGLLAIRRSGIYFAMITLALGQLIYFICLQAPLTGGENGLQGVPRGTLLGVVPLRSDLAMYYFVFALFVAVFLAIRRIVSSPFGQVLKAIRENEPRAISLGYDVDRYKLLVFVLSATIAGLAGALKALVLGFATLTDVLQATSGEVILMTLLGGAGTFLGPVVGAGVVVTLQDVLSDRVGSWVTVIIGGIFVLCVLAFRKGIVGEYLAWRERRVARA
ncbi:branched-chain amino acid ABC transporter permease [Ramlibacter sp.]|uniref:branched-chain amino acid ABC transporter permease n=1 Tax=Ramlibacter sp. TaxID=1917967 RepID=UPI002613C52F|nr:branched-chain amino acid ABC transporter permease [Ramlibacter sp.]MDB5957862.1 branched-chain amino acid transporter permease [Ramlibacter sp.]